MELNSKQRAMLRKIGNTIPVVLHIGKDGITPNTIKQAYDALEARELIKCQVLNNAPFGAKEACDILCEKVHAAPVQLIGNRFILFKRSREHPKYLLENDLTGLK